jgi:hypothetical protein
MSKLVYVKPERLWLKNDPELGEKWVQERIAADPGILGLGDLILKDQEKIQPGAGRLDLLLQDSDSPQRYEVEIQLGKTDESHIIRTIEYWDIERKKNPQYDHCAVIVAEDITSRFLNVIGLFNGMIPLVAIQLNAVKMGDQLGLVFTRVLDRVQFARIEEEEEKEVTNRAYWENLGSKATMAMADSILNAIHEFDSTVELKYNKFYIGLTRDGQPDNFVVMRAKRKFLTIEPRLAQSEEVTKELEDAGLDLMDYDNQWKRYRIRVAPDELDSHTELLKRLLRQAHEQGSE